MNPLLSEQPVRMTLTAPAPIPHTVRMTRTGANMRRRDLRVGQEYAVRGRPSYIGGAQYSGRIGMGHTSTMRGIVLDAGKWIRQHGQLVPVDWSANDRSVGVAMAVLERGEWKPVAVAPVDILRPTDAEGPFG